MVWELRRCESVVRSLPSLQKNPSGKCRTQNNKLIIYSSHSSNIHDGECFQPLQYNQLYVQHWYHLICWRYLQAHSKICSFQFFVPLSTFLVSFSSSWFSNPVWLAVGSNASHWGWHSHSDTRTGSTSCCCCSELEMARSVLFWVQLVNDSVDCVRVSLRHISPWSGTLRYAPP